MLNINQLTEQLRMMPDQALQRMAQMYKNDPYILPMVISEDTSRKKMRMAAQAQMAQPQPKVVDKALAAMGTPPQPAPGIAGLQAPNMEGMADGGIAGYAEGGVSDTAEDAFSQGGMFDFSQRSEPVVRMADGGVARYQDRGLVSADLPNAAATMYSSQMGASSDPLAEERRQQYVDELALQEAERVLQSYGVRQRAADPEGFQRALAAREAAAKKVSGAYRLPAVDEKERRYKDQRAVTPEELAIYKDLYPREAPKAPMLPIPDINATPSASGAAPGARPSAATGAGAAPSASTTGAPARTAVPSVEAAKQTAAQFLDSQAIEKRITDYQKAEAADIEAARERRRKALEGQGKAYEGLESLIKKEEAGAKGELEQSKAMAILNAGLAMMAGTSPRALENIGKGAMVGTGQYAEAIKDFKKSAKERQRAMADIEQARRAEARADTDAQLKFEERADERLGNARKYGVDALTSLGIKNADTARQIYTTQVEQQGAMDRARMQVNAPPAQLQLLTSLGRAMGAKDPESALKLGFELQTREQRIPALYENYVKLANSQKISLTGKGTEGEDFMRKYPTFETYLRGMSVQPGVTAGGTGGGFVQPPAGAPILR
jgi:hypothetical protein